MKSHITHLRSILRNSSLYDPKLEPQIMLTARLELQVEHLHEQFFSGPILINEINASGTKKQVANPIIPLLHKFESQLQIAYASLGLNYGINPNNLTSKSYKPHTSPLDQLMLRINGEIKE